MLEALVSYQCKNDLLKGSKLFLMLSVIIINDEAYLYLSALSGTLPHHSTFHKRMMLKIAGYFLQIQSPAKNRNSVPATLDVYMATTLTFMC